MIRRRYFRQVPIGGGGSFDINNYLTIVALEDGLTAQLSTNACEYCVDGDENWKTLDADTNTVSINKGHTLSFRGNLTPDSSNGIGTFTISKSCNLEGNCMSMLFGDDAVSNKSLRGKNYAFYRLFDSCRTIKSVSSGFLPATTLSNYCYASMFSGCTNLTTASELPATNLKDSCYDSMFYNCRSLSQVPELPATNLKDSCYDSMFYVCISLTQAPELPATNLAEFCYEYMFCGCTSLTQVPELPAMSLAYGCYQYMFWNCTSLTQAPELPATNLASFCYYGMFRDCTILTTAPELPATTLADYCYYSMFEGCSSLTTAPELPATTLVSNCYYQMFYGCSKLNYIKAMFTTTPSRSYTAYWVNGVASTGKFIKNKNATWNVTATSGNSYIGIPSGWSIQSAAE